MRVNTPLLLDMTPSQMYAGQVIQYNLYMKNVLSGIAATEKPVKDMKIGSTLLDYSDYIEADDNDEYT